MDWLLRTRLYSSFKELGFFPYVRRLDADDYETFQHVVEGPTSGGFVAVPTRLFGTVQGVVLTTDQPLGVRLHWQMDQAVELDAGGVLVLWDVNLKSVTQPIISVRYDGEEPATVEGLIVGRSLEEDFVA